MCLHVCLCLCAGKHVSLSAHVCERMCVFLSPSGNLCFVACVPSAWGHGGPCAGQLEAQSVEGVRCSVVGGRPDPHGHPDHLPRPPLWPGCAAWQAQPGTDSSAQANPQDAAKKKGEEVGEGFLERNRIREGKGWGWREGVGDCSWKGIKNSSTAKSRHYANCRERMIKTDKKAEKRFKVQANEGGRSERREKRGAKAASSQQLDEKHQGMH